MFSTSNKRESEDISAGTPLTHGSVQHPRHRVQLYATETQLCDAVCEFIGGGLARNEPLVGVATAAHRTAFLQTLRVRGLQPDLAIVAGNLILLDAEATLARFMVDGMPDWERFRATVAGVLDELTAKGTRRVRAFGEMVDVLWRSGNPKAAIRLEEMWSELQRSYGFTLLCAYVLGNFEESGLQSVCHLHDEVVIPQPGDDTPHVHALAAEIARRKQVELGLRDSLHELRRAQNELERSQAQLRASERRLQIVTDTLPALVAYVDREQRYRSVNVAHEPWYGRPRTELVGKSVEQVMGSVAYAIARPHIEAALAGEKVHYEALLPGEGVERYIEATYLPHLGEGGAPLGYVEFISDISERKRLERAREAAARRNERMSRITAAIADAVTLDQVYETVVDQFASALSAQSGGLWIVSEDGRSARMVRSFGYTESQRERFGHAVLESADRFPALDAIRERRPIWIESQTALLEAYPELESAVTPELTYRVVCLPMMSQGRILGALGLTFELETAMDELDRAFMQNIAERAAMAIQSARLRLDNQRAHERTELLYRLTSAVIRAESVEQVFDAALGAIGKALGTMRSAVLAFDAGGVMRFRAQRGLSEEYRAAVEGHSPWTRDAVSPQPVLVSDVELDPSLAAYLPLFRREHIGALAFIPLVSGTQLIGKFMVYYDSPRELRAHEIHLATAIADNVAAALHRFEAMAELERSLRFNEMFTGILGHDLRNPLGAIMMAANLVLMRDDSESTRPLLRVLSSGARMTRMIDQLLDFTRVRIGAGIPLNPARIDVVPVLRQAMDELADAHPGFDVRLEYTGDTRGAWDSDRLLQVFSNLIANALQHGVAEHGVQLRIDGTLAERVTITIHNMGAVPAELIPKVFDPMMGGQRRHAKSQGLGLGLYITREIVKAHGGQIEVRSSATSGTTFSLVLPRQHLTPRESPAR